MYCLECKKLIVTNITYKNIFWINPNKHLLCNACMIKYQYINQLIVLPIERYVLYLNILFDYYNKQISDAYMSFLKPYYLMILRNKVNKIILYFDEFTENVYNILNILKLDDLFVIVLENKMIKENIYED